MSADASGIAVWAAAAPLRLEAVEGGVDDLHAVREQVLGLRRRAGLPRPSAA